MDKSDKAYKGQSVYNKFTLSLYDFWVLGFSNHLLWKCETSYLKKHFKTYLSSNHVDIGVGTGYYLKHCLEDKQKRIALIDLNEHSLNKAKNSIEHLNAEIYQANVLKDFSLECDKFDSLSINYLLHCLPGCIEEKSILFKHIQDLLNDDAIIFGSTILNKNIEKNIFATKLMDIYNKKGIFDNANDSYYGLKSMLEYYFKDVKIELKGCVAIFSAKKK